MTKITDAAKSGAKMGGAMIAQDAMHNIIAKLATKLGVPAGVLEETLKDQEILADVLNVCSAAGAMAAADQIDHPWARFIAAGAEAALTGRVALAAYKHGSELAALGSELTSELMGLAKAGAMLLGEDLPDLTPAEAPEPAAAASVLHEAKKQSA